MATKTGICNLALSHLGTGKRIASMDEKSQEAEACDTFFDIERDATLRAFNWPFAKRTKTLSLVEEDPTSSWGYAYRYPAGCLMVRKILSGVRNSTSDTQVPYELAGDDDGLLMYTDQLDPVIEYTKRVTETEHYPADFALALSYRLAAAIAPRVTGGDPFKIQESAMSLYKFELGNAMVAAAQEMQRDVTPESEFIRVRS